MFPFQIIFDKTEKDNQRSFIFVVPDGKIILTNVLGNFLYNLSTARLIFLPNFLALCIRDVFSYDEELWLQVNRHKSFCPIIIVTS